MKKISALLLAAIMGLSLIACDNTQTEIEENDTVIENKEQTEENNEQPAEETPAEPEEEQTEDTTDEEPVEEEILVEENTQEEETEVPEEIVFDKKWAGNEYEMPIPKPPFECNVGHNKTDNIFTIYGSAENTQSEDIVC